MADEVVGRVTVEVRGDTGPLKRDIRTAVRASDASVDIDVRADAATVADAITEQVDASAKPAERSGERVGAAITRGIAKGARPEGTGSGIDRAAGDFANRFVDSVLGRTRRERLGERIQQIVADETGQVQIGPDLSAPIRGLRTFREKFDAEFRRRRPTARMQIDAAVDSDAISAALRAEESRLRAEIAAIEERLSIDIDVDVSTRSTLLADLNRIERSLAGTTQRLRSRRVSITEQLGLTGRDLEESSGALRERISGLLDSLGTKIRRAIPGLLLKGGLYGLIGAGLAGAVRALGPLLLGLSQQISIVGSGLAGLGVVGGAALGTMLPGVIAVKKAFAGLDAEEKKALIDRFKEAAPSFKGFGEAVRGSMIDPLIEATKQIDVLGAATTRMGQQSGAAVAGVATKLADLVTGKDRKGDIEAIFAGTPDVIRNFGTVLTNVADVGINALAALQPLVKTMTEDFAEWSTGIRDTFNAKIDDGTFATTMERWYERGRTLLRIFGNLGGVLSAVFRTNTNTGAGFLKTLERITTRWENWSKSIEGQNQIRGWFSDARDVMTEFWGLLSDIAGLFGESFTGDTSGLVGFIRSIRENVIPAIERMQDIIRDSGLQDALYGLADAILRFFESGGGGTATAFVTTLTLMVEVLADLFNVLGPLAGPLMTVGGALLALNIGKGQLSRLTGLYDNLVNIAGVLRNWPRTPTMPDTGGGTPGRRPSRPRTPTGTATGARAAAGAVAGVDGSDTALAGRVARLEERVAVLTAEAGEVDWDSPRNSGRLAKAVDALPIVGDFILAGVTIKALWSDYRERKQSEPGYRAAQERRFDILREQAQQGTEAGRVAAKVKADLEEEAVWRARGDQTTQKILQERAAQAEANAKATADGWVKREAAAREEADRYQEAERAKLVTKQSETARTADEAKRTAAAADAKAEREKQAREAANKALVAKQSETARVAAQAKEAAAAADAKAQKALDRTVGAPGPNKRWDSRLGAWVPARSGIPGGAGSIPIESMYGGVSFAQPQSSGPGARSVRSGGAAPGMGTHYGGMTGRMYDIDPTSPSGIRDADEKRVHVEINNYYPEPERASESLAMSLRLARYVVG